MKQTARQVLHGSTALAAAQVTANLAAFLLSWSVARGMGDVAYGQFAAAYALATSIAALADSGIRVTLIREVARHAEGWCRLLRHALLISGALAILVSAGFFVVVSIREAADEQALRLWLLVFALLWTGVRILLGVPAGRQKLVTVAVWGALERLGGALLVATMAFFSDVSLLELAQWLCVWEGFTVLSVWLWIKSQHWPSDSESSLRALQFARIAVPFGVAATVQAVLGRLDLIVLGFQQAPETTGHYAAAQLLALIGVFFGVSVANAMFPALSGLAKDSGVEQARALLEPALGLLGLLMVVMAAVLAAMANPLLTWIYGDTFAGGSAWLALFALASPLAAVGAMSGAVIGAWGWQGKWARVLLLVLILAMPAYWLIGSRFGFWGVAGVNIGVQLMLSVTAWYWMANAGLVNRMWLLRLLGILCILGICVFLLHGWSLALLPLLSIGLVFALRVCRVGWLGTALRMIR